MVTIYSERNSATLVIPAAYLHDVRSAIINQCVQDSDDLRCDHEAVLNANEELLQIAANDRAHVLRRMNENVSVLNQVFDAEGDTAITDTAEKLAGMLGVMNRLLSERLATGCMPDEEPAELLGRLDEMRWAAEEAIRLDPRLGERAGDEVLARHLERARLASMARGRSNQVGVDLAAGPASTSDEFPRYSGGHRPCPRCFSRLTTYLHSATSAIRAARAQNLPAVGPCPIERKAAMSTQAAGVLDVGDDHVGLMRPRLTDQVGGVRGNGNDIETSLCQDVNHTLANQRLILSYDHSKGRMSGHRTINPTPFARHSTRS